jgi:hypothetical protein
VTKIAIDEGLKDVWVEGHLVYAAGNGPAIGVITAQWEDEDGLWVDVELTPEARGVQGDEDEHPFG